MTNGLGTFWGIGVVYALDDLHSGVNGKVSRRAVLRLLAERGLERAS